MRLWKDKRGATAIEYGLIASLIGVAAMTGMSATGTGVKEQFCKIASTLPAGGGSCEGSGTPNDANHHFGLTDQQYASVSDEQRQRYGSFTQGQAVWLVHSEGEILAFDRQTAETIRDSNPAAYTIIG